MPSMRISDEAISLLEIITEHTTEHGRDAIAKALVNRSEQLLNAYLERGIANTTTQEDKSFFGALTEARDFAQLFQLDLSSEKAKLAEQNAAFSKHAEFSRLT